MVVLTSSTALPSFTSIKSSFSTIEGVDSALELTKSTHLHLERRSISEIVNLSLRLIFSYTLMLVAEYDVFFCFIKGELCRCPKLSVLYLFDNKIERLQNLDFCPNLTHLYLQNNHLRRVENLQCLTSLQKLWVSQHKYTKSSSSKGVVWWVLPISKNYKIKWQFLLTDLSVITG